METSILYCIKDPIPFLIIGGTSGIGKTAIIDFLLANYPDFFEQPISYTSRQKRSETDRYIFTSKEDMIRLNQNGEFINFDEVHNDYYGIKKNEINRIKSLNKIPIKEIHPNNFHKFSDKGFNTVKIIIESKDDGKDSSPYINREGRPLESFSSDCCDFKLNILNLNIEQAAHLLLKKLLAYKIHLSLFPHLNIIDKVNKDGYQQIAKEFDDDKRITTKNFHDASLEFWSSFFSNLDPSRNRILELGYGNGWLFKTFHKGKNTVYGVDISENMISNLFDITLNTSSRNIPVKASSFDYVVGSLIDPLISLETFVEIERLLNKNGLFAFTIPAKEWAINLPTRPNKNETTFVKQSGEKVNVFSFCNAVEMIPIVLNFLGFEVKFVKSYSLPNNYDKSISSAIIDSAKNCGKQTLELPIVTTIILKKKDE